MVTKLTEKKPIFDSSSLVARLLEKRGIVSDEEREEFLNPKGLHDPFLLPDMDKAVDRILQAIDKKEMVIIYSDYDADGIPGGVVLHDFFKMIGFDNFENYIPHRHDEGFGFHKESIEEFANKKVDLIITVDCGISDVETVECANKKGIDVIITDHHEQINELPKAVAVVDHKTKDSIYPESVLCGAGVAFQLVRAILSKKDFGLESGQEKKKLLDLVGMATISDMVPLIGENRVLAKYGLEVLRKSRRPGLVRLLNDLKINQEHINEDDLSFMITPRINAASRMGKPEDAFTLLATEDETVAGVASAHLNKINEDRKRIVASVVKDANKRLKKRNIEKDQGVIVIGSPEWRPSLLGLVANSLVEDFGKTVFMWGRDGGGVLKGSCRSDGSVDLACLMNETGEDFLHFGGHSLAGGFAVSEEKIHVLEEVLNKAYKKISSIKNVETDLIDAHLSIEEVSEETFQMIDKLAPFGIGNPKPVFLFKSVSPVSVRKFGKKGNHLELTFSKEGGHKIKAIAFFKSPKDFSKTPEAGGLIDLLASVEKSFYNGFSGVRLRVVDIK